jgi:LysM repeat protein
MATQSKSSSPGYRLCPTCGTRVGAAATKCLVCGTDLSGVTGSTGPVKATGTVLGRRPISLVTVLILFGIIVAAVAGGALVFAQTEAGQNIINPPTETPTATATLQPTLTFTPTPTETPEPTATPLPPVDYVVQSGDSCVKIAVNGQVSVQSIIDVNGGLINPACTNLVPGSTIKVPQPTPTPSPLPTATLARIEATAVPRPTYIIQAGDQLQSIASFYGLNLNDLMQANGITDPNRIQSGQVLVIPIDKVPPRGPTVTPTVPPPYPAPQLLSPADGEAFVGVESVTLQWVAVNQLQPGEFFRVTVEDVTANSSRILRDVVPDNRYIIPATFQPADSRPHIYRWSVTVVRQRPNADPNQRPVYDSAGLSSPEHTFVWVGAGGGSTPSP